MFDVTNATDLHSPSSSFSCCCSSSQHLPALSEVLNDALVNENNLAQCHLLYALLAKILVIPINGQLYIPHSTFLVGSY